jgi:peptidoglycan/LPS O-acetylase OafA/YrhL
MTARRWPALDGLRGIAILFVVVAHSGIIHAVVAGMIGVTLFFVLSGFLITYLLLDEMSVSGTVNLRAFYGRRAIRLLPALTLYLIGMAVLLVALGLKLPIWDMTWPPALYVGNYAQVFGHDLVAHRHLWSLAVEEHFYLVWPVLVLLGVTKRFKVLGWALIGLAVWRLGVGMANPLWAYHATDTNAYALVLGCLLAIAHHRGWRIPITHRMSEAGVIVMAMLALIPVTDLDHLYSIGVWLPPLAAAIAGVCVLVAVDSNPAFLTGKWIMWFGAISYTLYLWHAPLLMIPELAATPLTRLGAILLSIVIAWGSWRFIETPILKSRLRQRFSPGRGVVKAMATSEGP